MARARTDGQVIAEKEPVFTPLADNGLDVLKRQITKSDREVSDLKRQVAELHKLCAGKGSGQVDITADGMINEVDDSLRTPYSMCVGLLLGNDASTLLCIAAVLLQLILMVAQLTLAYAFLDCSQLFAVRGDFPMYASPIDMQNFYADDGRWGGQPAITVQWRRRSTCRHCTAAAEAALLCPRGCC